MRKLLWFTIGFVIIAVTFVYLLPVTWLFIICGIGILAAVPIILFRKRIIWWRIFLTVLSGACVASIWIAIFQTVYFDKVEDYHGKEVILQIEVCDYSSETDYGISCEGYISLEGKRYKIRFYLNGDEDLSPGDEVTGIFKLKSTLTKNGSDSTYYQGEGVYFTASLKEDAKVIHSESVPVKYFSAMLRRQILHTINEVFPDDTVGFARALLLGDTSLLSYEEDTAYKISGIRHIVAVSGLHVSILFAFIYVLAGKRRILTAVLGIPLLLLFAAVAGFTPSVMRACIMQSLMILAMLLNKEYDPPSALSFAVLVMLISNPLAASSVSLQLSAGCLVGIFLFSQRIYNYLLSDKLLGNAKGKTVKAKLKRWFAGSISVSLGAMTATTPLCAFYFETVSIISVLSNLLILWAVNIIYYAIMTACIFSSFLLPLGKGIAWLASWLIRYVQFLSAGLASVPFAAVYTCSIYILVWLIFSYILFAVFLFLKKKHPWVLCICICVGLILSIGLSCIEPRTDDYRITVLDVGQGQSILIQSGGENYLVDCGGDYGEYATNKAAQLLLSQGIRSLDGVILTHFDEDHVGGFQYLQTRISIESIYVTDFDTKLESLLSIKDSTDFSVYTVRENLKKTLGNGILTIFAPEQGRSGNESSLCVLFQSEKCDILITGDRNIRGEKHLLANNEIPVIDILVVGHHGADNSTSYELLQATKPSCAVISVNEDNRYGHPQKEVLDKLTRFGCKILRTDIHGTIVFRG